MARTTTILSLGILGLGLVEQASSAVLCARRKSDGTVNGAVQIRSACTPREVQLDPVALGLRGPAGSKGDPGPVGPAGPTGPPQQDVSARVSGTADVAVPADVLVFLNFDLERWDTANLHDPASPSRLTAPVTGTYQIDCQGSWKTNGGGWRNIDLWLNGALVIAVNTENGSADHHTQHFASTQYRLTAGDYIECGVSTVPGAVLATSPPGLASTLEFSMTLITP